MSPGPNGAGMGGDGVMTLRRLLEGLATPPPPPLPVKGLTVHSKRVRPGEVFIAVRGAVQDGHAFLDEAIQRGASAVVVERRPAGRVPCAVAVVPNTTQALPVMASRFYGEPAHQLRLIGTTGTCGKTTTVYLLKRILEASGCGVGLLGTVAYEIGERHLPSSNTTPGALELQRHLAEMVRRHLSWCVMEVSSHALDQGRVEGLQFEAAIFTNLGTDHLDYHGTRDRYAQAKRRLFDHTPDGAFAVLNVDDPTGVDFAASLPRHRLVTYSLGSEGFEATGPEEAGAAAEDLTPPAAGKPTVSVRHVRCGWEGTSLVLESPWGDFPIQTPLVGRHNVANVLAACGATLALGVAPAAIQQALEEFPVVPGRLERVPNDAGLTVLIDYAHTPDALRLVLLAVRELTHGRLLVVFGCGGDRDSTKRPAMGRIASLLADYVVVTSDNPRQEDPLAIARQIHAGFVPGFGDCQLILDREDAIRTALAMARPDDTVIIAGKGHETCQIFDHLTVSFSDREVVERTFAHSARAIPV